MLWRVLPGIERKLMIESEELTSNLIYDSLATTYGLDFDQTYTQFLKYSLLERSVRPSDVVLDIGIGNGIFTLPIARLVKEVHGLDISPVMLAECRRNLRRAAITNVLLYERSPKHMPFSASAFDVVFSYSTLLLIPEPGRVYEEIGRVIKPGGLAVLDITGKYNLSRVYWNKYYRQQGHFGVNAYALSKIQGIFSALSFEILETHATGLLDQWKYIRGLKPLGFLENIFHRTSREPDLDYRISQLFPALANRWYFILWKKRVG
jgi:ubiquinone/menaquinone biosynthesis C-methylase UbiE